MALSFFSKKKDDPYSLVNAYAPNLSSAYKSYSQSPNNGTQQRKSISPYLDAAKASYSRNVPNPQRTTRVNFSANQKPAGTPQPQQQPGLTPYQEILNKSKSILDERRGSINQNAQGQIGSLRDIQARRAETGKQNIQAVQDFGNKSAANIRSGIESQQQLTADQKAGIERGAGQDLRQLAQSNIENQGNLQNLFAGLGTLDSSAFQNQAAKATRDFTSRQAEVIEQKRADLNAADAAFQQYQQEAQGLVDQIEFDVGQAIRDLQLTMDTDSIEYAQAEKEILNQAQMQVNEIESTLANMEMDLYQKQQELKLEQQAEMQGQDDSRNQLVSVINQLRDLPYNSITGVLPVFKGNPIDALSGRKSLTKNVYDQLKGMLSLENISKLKGTGAISDAEQKLLAQASTALNTNLRNEDFGMILDQLAEQFGANDSLAQYRSSLRQGEFLAVNPQTGDVIALSQGEQIPAGFVKQ